MPRGPGRARPAQDTLMVFFKEPVEGFVKTRLAKEIGKPQALLAFRVLLRYTFDVVRDLKGPKVVLYYDSQDKGAAPMVDLNMGWSYSKQSSGDLGQRFLAAFEEMFSKGASKVVVIGSDCVGLTTDILKAAFDGLKDHDITIGPSEDGGYYILGLKDAALAKRLLTGIHWSTDMVLQETLERAKGSSVKYLPRLYDVDTKKDWDRARREDKRIAALLKELQTEGGP